MDPLRYGHSINIIMDFSTKDKVRDLTITFTIPMVTHGKPLKEDNLSTKDKTADFIIIVPPKKKNHVLYSEVPQLWKVIFFLMHTFMSMKVSRGLPSMCRLPLYMAGPTIAALTGVLSHKAPKLELREREREN